MASRLRGKCGAGHHQLTLSGRGPDHEEHRFLVVGVKAHRGRAQEASVSTAHSQISVESKRTRRSITSRASSASW